MSMTRRKKRRIMKRVLRTIYMMIFVSILFFCVYLVKNNFIDDKNKTDNNTTQEMTFSTQEVIAPVKRTENEVLLKLEKLSLSDDKYKYIYENSDRYPEDMLAALVNNSELLDFVRGYLENDGSQSGGLTDSDMESAYPLLMQWDERWAYETYGDSIVGMAGCGPACLAMVVDTLTNLNKTPYDIAKYSENNGYYVDGVGTAWALMSEGAEAFGVNSNEISLSEDVIKGELDSQHLIVCAMGPGDFTTAGHFIVIYGYDKEGFKINDPNSRARSSKKWSYETLSSQIKNLWEFDID